MAVGNIRETSNAVLQTSRDEQGRRMVSWTRTFTGVSDSPSTDTEYHARLAIATTGTVAGEFITEGSSHPLNPWVTVESINVVRKGPLLYEFTVTYKSPKFQGENGEPTDPDFEPPELEFSTATTEEPVDSDWNGEAIATATGELFTGLTVPIGDLVATITKKYSYFDPAAFYAYRKKVNTDTFLGHPAGTALVDEISAKRIWQGEMFYWSVTVKIAFREPYGDTPTEKAWYWRVRHEGYRCFKPGGPFNGPGDSVPCKDGERHDATTPMLLNEDGTQRLEVGADADWLYFQKFGTVAFSGMNLGV